MSYGGILTNYTIATDNRLKAALSGAEQMYQALRTLGIPTQLVIFPVQFHGITKPSYQVDRFERYFKWFGQYLKK